MIYIYVTEFVEISESIWYKIKKDSPPDLNFMQLRFHLGLDVNIGWVRKGDGVYYSRFIIEDKKKLIYFRLKYGF